MNFYNAHLEQSFLSGLFHNNHFLIETKMKPEDLYFPEHGDIFREMMKLISAKGSIILQDFALWSQGKTFGDGPAYEYLAGIMDIYPPDFESLKGIEFAIKELSRKRELEFIILKAKNELETQSAADVQSLLTSGIRETIQNTEIKSCAEVRAEIIKELERPLERQKTGLQCLDDAMGGGMYQGYTYGLCGPEKAGKTTLAHTISQNLECKHLYIAMEMDGKQIERRNIARLAGFNSLKFLDKDPSALKNKVESAINRKNIYYLDLASGTLDDIIMHVGMAVIKYGIRGFIVDYWQLVGGAEKGDNEEKHLRKVAQSIASFARKNNLWCIMLAQMNKDGATFGSSGIKKACDQLYMIEFCPNVNKQARWLRMDASRYTFQGDIGSETEPAIYMENNNGPYFRDAMNG